jgi:hypothetical protein
LEQARENGMERAQKGQTVRRGGRQVFMVVREKRQGSAARAFPNWAAAKPRGQTARLRLLYIISAKNLGLNLNIIKLWLLKFLEVVYDPFF